MPMNEIGDVFRVPDKIVLNNIDEWGKIEDFKEQINEKPKYIRLDPKCLVELQNSYQIYKENMEYQLKYREIEKIVQIRKEDSHRMEIEEMIGRSTPNPILHEIEIAEKRKRDEEKLLEEQRKKMKEAEMLLFEEEDCDY